MRISLLLAVLALYLCGCLAIVNEKAGKKEVKSFMITEEETIDMLEQIDDLEPNSEYEIELFKKKEK